MRFELKEVSICAEKEFELIRITDPVREFVAQTGVKERRRLCHHGAHDHRHHGEREPALRGKGYYGDAGPDRAGKLSLPS